MSLKHRIEYAAIRTLVLCVRALPAFLVPRLGAAIGALAYAVDRRHRRIARENVAAALPGRSTSEQRAIVLGAFKHFGRLLLEFLRFDGMSEDALLRQVEFEGEDRARAAFAQGNGVLFITGHFGFWELQAMVHALRLPPMAVMARALDNPALHRLVEEMRTRTGTSVIYRQGGIRRVMRRLQAGEAVGVLIDQHVLGQDAVTVDFFGRPAATTSAVAKLALRTGARVVPLFALPLPDGRYRMIYEHAIEPPDKDSPDPIRDFTQRCTDVLEMYVRRNPELWLWMHRRWRADAAR